MHKQIEVNIPVSGSNVVFNTKDDLYVDELNINTAIMELAGNFSYWGVLKNNFEKTLNDLQLEYDIWMAQNKVAIDNPPGNANLGEP